MEQYFTIREKYPDTLLFFQVGDFFELFFEHAQAAAAVLGIALTKRGTHDGEPIPLCGVPLHALDHHLFKLVKAGYHVAICEQLENPKPGSIVKRGVTQVLTPGTLTDTKLLDDKRASFLCSCFISHETIVLVFAELLTGQLHATLIKGDDVRAVETQLYRYMPDEIILHGERSLGMWQKWLKQQGFRISSPVVVIDNSFGDWLQKFPDKQQEVVKKSAVMHVALEQLYLYLNKNQSGALDHFRSCTFYRVNDFLVIDAATQRNLELVRNMHDGTAMHTLFSILDRSVTAMGARTIKKWLLSPLINKKHIEHRLDAVETFVADIGLTQKLVEILHDLGDVERIVGRIALQRAQLYDYVHLKCALGAAPKIKAYLKKCDKSKLLQRIDEAIVNFLLLHQLLDASLNDDTSKDWIIKRGFDHQLDELRDVLLHAHDKVIELEKREQEETGIGSLKVRYNQVHGYYIELTKANLHLVPDRYARRQTLVSKERFTTPELTELEHQLTKARTEISAIEQRVYERVKNEVYAEINALRNYAYALANVDASIGLALTAYDKGYVRPVIHEEGDINIKDGKHPVVGSALGTDFISNDTQITDEQKLWILTGPNMGGKSTYLRQVALICLLAHCGSFVPAAHADIPILDRIFTRVGAGDNLAEGKSTFLVEMEETATICLQATEKSLVILDEVGRGTSTYDGLAIAQAVVEYLHHTVKASCLFATHYHELTQLEGELPGIINYYAASKQRSAGILFLHKIIPGVAAGSFGLEVAKLAKLPDSLVKRAAEVLQELTKHQTHYVPAHNVPAQQELVPVELSSQDKEVIEELRKIDMENITPRQAHELLWKIKEISD